MLDLKAMTSRAVRRCRYPWTLQSRRRIPSQPGSLRDVRLRLSPVGLQTSGKLELSRTVFGRFLPIMATKRAGQVQCNRWSERMKMSGQVECNFAISWAFSSTL